MLHTYLRGSQKHRRKYYGVYDTRGRLAGKRPISQGMTHLTQPDCNRIASHLNRRPHKRLGYRTPEECYVL